MRNLCRVEPLPHDYFHAFGDLVSIITVMVGVAQIAGGPNDFEDLLAGGPKAPPDFPPAAPLQDAEV
jgi:hypothetical protein